MEASQRSEKILALGQRLVEELGLEPSVDTLGRWMAHHIADLMHQVQTATGEERLQAENRCFEAILSLWEHRNELPNGKRPFADLEVIIRAVQSLDPDEETPRYFRTVQRGTEDEKESSKAREWLSMANGLDHTAKILIRECFVEAARETMDKSKEWVALADAAGAERGAPEIVIRFVSDKEDIETEPDPYEKTRKRLEDRIKRLEGFTRLASAFADDYRNRLKALPEPKE
jgi:hypothetical protein